jgi:hypothetical protein
VPTDGERLATVEAVLTELRGDVSELKTETLRTRGRLHKMESMAAVFVQTQKENRAKEEAQYRRLATWIGIAGLLLTFAVLVSPLIHFLLTRK